MADNQFLEGYIKKLMEREMQSGSDKPLTEAQLKQVALDTGMMESEWEQLKSDANNAQERGFEHLDRNNFEDAISEFQESTSLYPNSAQACYGMAKALFKKTVEKEDKTYSLEAINYVKRALLLDPDHSEALDLQGQIRQHDQVLGDKIVTKGRVAKWKKILIPALPIVLLIGWFWSLNNTIVDLEEDVNSSWAQVENVCNRRAELIPQLAKVVKAAAAHEKDVIESALRARAKATSINIDPSNMTASDMKKFAEAQGQLGASLGRLMAVSERYPDVKAMANYRDLQTQIEGSDNRITVERMRFNQTVEVFNKKVKKFPVSLLSYHPKPYFEVPDQNLQVPELDL